MLPFTIFPTRRYYPVLNRLCFPRVNLEFLAVCTVYKHHVKKKLTLKYYGTYLILEPN